MFNGTRFPPEASSGPLLAHLFNDVENYELITVSDAEKRRDGPFILPRSNSPVCATRDSIPTWQ